jgi:transcription elongation factor S-II
MSALTTVKDLKIALLKELPAVSDAQVEHCRNVLDRLSDCSVTIEILTETLVGKEVTKLKNHEHLGSLAKGLIKKWKKVAAANGASAASASATASAKVKSERRDSSMSAGSGSNSAPNPEAEWIGLPPHRQNMCQKFYSFLAAVKPDLKKKGMHPDAVDHLTGPRAAEIEGAIYDKFRNQHEGYANKARSLAFNLKKNRSLCQQVVLGQISGKELTNMTSEQMAPAETTKAREVEAAKLSDANRLDWDQAHEHEINEMCGIRGDLLKASLFTCGRCKSIKTTSTQKQTRSADEPMTVFVLCLDCGKRWKC